MCLFLVMCAVNVPINPTRIVLLKEKSEVVLKPSTVTPHVLSFKRANVCEVVLKHHKDIVYMETRPFKRS